MLEEVVLTAALPERRRWSDLVGRTRAEIDEVATLEADLSEQRRAVEAEVDPRPAPPSWARDSREGRVGHPFWKLVDFRRRLRRRPSRPRGCPGGCRDPRCVDPARRAARGRLLDMILTSGEATDAASSSLATMLRPDVHDSGVSEAVVEQVLEGLLLGAGDATGPDVGRSSASTGPGGSGPWSGGRPRTPRSTSAFRLVQRNVADGSPSSTRDSPRWPADVSLSSRSWMTRPGAGNASKAGWHNVPDTTRSCGPGPRRTPRSRHGRPERELDQATRRAMRARIDAAAAHTELTNAAAVHDLPTTADALEPARRRSSTWPVPSTPSSTRCVG